MNKKETWFLVLKNGGRFGIGECGLLRGLSFDDVPEYEQQLKWVCDNIGLDQQKLVAKLAALPSIQFGVEQAFLSLRSENPFELFPSNFTKNEAPIEINGLIWMGSKDFMLQQIQQKLEEGFSCLKMKIGAIDFETERAILKSIRKRFSAETIELRVDANGAFSVSEALKKLEILSKYQIHSIEQPIHQGNWAAMAGLCKKTPLPIALDEELIGVTAITKRKELLQTIKPQYIILKPSLVGGFAATKEWIDLAKKNKIGWWITSALESNIGLNAIAQFTHTLHSQMPQGLGTGSLYTNNFESPLEVIGGKLFYKNGLSWQPDLIQQLCT